MTESKDKVIDEIVEVRETVKQWATKNENLVRLFRNRRAVFLALTQESLAQVAMVEALRIAADTDLVEKLDRSLMRIYSQAVWDRLEKPYVDDTKSQIVVDDEFDPNTPPYGAAGVSSQNTFAAPPISEPEQLAYAEPTIREPEQEFSGEVPTIHGKSGNTETRPPFPPISATKPRAQESRQVEPPPPGVAEMVTKARNRSGAKDEYQSVANPAYEPKHPASGQVPGSGGAGQ